MKPELLVTSTLITIYVFFTFSIIWEEKCKRVRYVKNDPTYVSFLDMFSEFGHTTSILILNKKSVYLCKQLEDAGIH